MLSPQPSLSAWLLFGVPWSTPITSYLWTAAAGDYGEGRSRSGSAVFKGQINPTGLRCGRNRLLRPAARVAPPGRHYCGHPRPTPLDPAPPSPLFNLSPHGCVAHTPHTIRGLLLTLHKTRHSLPTYPEMTYVISPAALAPQPRPRCCKPSSVQNTQSHSSDSARREVHRPPLKVIHESAAGVAGRRGGRQAGRQAGWQSAKVAADSAPQHVQRCHHAAPPHRLKLLTNLRRLPAACPRVHDDGQDAVILQRTGLNMTQGSGKAIRKIVRMAKQK
ncbi:hypothetical protein E2C01_054372 [Portunus trituberculatus]|uniref:Uncharacterized protein n=1 Tax=Portunus trituberculatus TaxID=210409 RepID=A0A5B7GJN5_PORTR|nr:hypothetical protein [Portunus trituberculatus]